MKLCFAIVLLAGMALGQTRPVNLPCSDSKSRMFLLDWGHEGATYDGVTHRGRFQWEFDNDTLPNCKYPKPKEVALGQTTYKSLAECEAAHDCRMPTAALVCWSGAEGVWCEIEALIHWEPFSTRKPYTLPLVEPERPNPYSEPVFVVTASGQLPYCTDDKPHQACVEAGYAVDVPAIQVPAKSSVIQEVNCDSDSHICMDGEMACTNNGTLVDSGQFQLSCKDGWVYSCKDTSRVLLDSVDGKTHHCIKF